MSTVHSGEIEICENPQQENVSSKLNVEINEKKECEIAITNVGNAQSVKIAVHDPTENEISNKSLQSWENELNEAIAHAKQLGALARKRVLEESKQKILSLQQTDDSLDVNMLNDAFNLLRDQFLPNNIKDTDDDDSVTVNVDENENENEDEDENGTAAEEKSYEEFDADELNDIQNEIREAFDNVRKLGNRDGRELATRLSETFYETNGRDPDATELHSIFCRLKQTLMDEADEEVLDNIEDDCIVGDKNIETENECEHVSNEILENILNDNGSDDSDYEPTVEDEEIENAAENELVAEHEETCDVDDTLDDNNNVEIDINTVDLPENIERDEFLNACNELEKMRNNAVTRSDIDNIISHLADIALEDNHNTIVSEIICEDDENDSDYVPNEDEVVDEHDSSDDDDSQNDEGNDYVENQE